LVFDEDAVSLLDLIHRAISQNILSKWLETLESCMEHVEVKERFDGQQSEVKFESNPLNLSVHPSNILFPSKDRVTFSYQVGCKSKVPMV
jgi:hypothetical protein